MKFKDVGIKREFKTGVLELIKIPYTIKYSYCSETGDQQGYLEHNCIAMNGDLHFIVDDFEVELIDNCLHCKHHEKVADHMYKYGGGVGMERYDDVCKKHSIGIGNSNSCSDRIVDVKAETFTCPHFEKKE